MRPATGIRLSVIMADLDHFKRLNDSHGHAAGDLVLRHVGALLAANVRGVDTAGRYGGEEFLIVLPETDADAAASVAEKLRRVVAGTALQLPDGETVVVTLSAGVAGGMGGVMQPDVLVRDADAALYSAKALGRDQVYVFRETGDEGTVRRAPIAAEARNRALDVGREAMRAATDALMRTLVGRPAWAGKPSTLIAEASVALAHAIDLPKGELERIRTASLLHDLGKLAIPDEILAKPGDLAASEWRVVTEHPKIGQVVLEQAGALRDAATIVLHHHEWYDGRGYPHGLVGTEIPVGARIVSIVDAYEAMIAGRPYRTAITHEEAIGSCVARVASSSTRSWWRSSPRSSRRACPGSRTPTSTTTNTTMITVPRPPLLARRTCQDAEPPPIGSASAVPGRSRRPSSTTASTIAVAAPAEPIAG